MQYQGESGNFQQFCVGHREVLSVTEAFIPVVDVSAK